MNRQISSSSKNRYSYSGFLSIQESEYSFITFGTIFVFIVCQIIFGINWEYVASLLAGKNLGIEYSSVINFVHAQPSRLNKSASRSSFQVLRCRSRHAGYCVRERSLIEKIYHTTHSKMKPVNSSQ